MLPDNSLQTFELWVTKGEDYNVEELTKTLDRLGLISTGNNILDFDGVAVLLIKATKQNRREQGTVQSDWFECTAAELANCGNIVVYPGTGWWKERKLANVDNIIKYSLIISIETSETEIYNAVKTEINNKIGIPITQES